MLSTKLVQSIENNWDEIASRLIRSIRQHRDLPALAGKSDAELTEWCRNILQPLGDLLSGPKDDLIRKRFELLGRQRYEESIPLHEAVLRAQLLREKIVGFIYEQGFPSNSVQLYAQEQLEQRIALFFDALVYSIVRGYEAAMRRALRLAS
jgi:hypothetical protein